MASLTIVTSEGEELEFELTDSHISIGRDEDNAITIPDGSISGSHAELVQSGDTYELKDLGSTNGSQVNGEKIENATLSDGDSVMLGHCSGKFTTGAAGAGDQPLPEPSESSLEGAPADTSLTPESFANASPFTQKVKEKDPKGQAVLALGIVALLVSVGSIACAVIMKAG